MVDHEPSTNVIAAGAVTNVARYLKGLRYPATKDDVQRVARQNGADPSALDEIATLPSEGRFRDPLALIGAIGEPVHALDERR